MSIKKKNEEFRDSMEITVKYLHVNKWRKEIGNDSFCLWLELITHINRRDTRNVITMSQGDLMKLLGMNRKTYYRHIKPLYEYGLIDYIEYIDPNDKDTKDKKGKQKNKAQNIIVHLYPLGEKERRKKPLEKLRDWDDRTTVVAPFSLKGGRKKGSKEVEKDIEVPTEEKQPNEVPAEEPKAAKPRKEKAAPKKKVVAKKDNTEQIAINSNVSELVKLFVEQKESELIKNGVKMNSLIQWLNHEATEYAEEDIVLVLEQCIGYHEFILSTKAFCRRTYTDREKIRQARAYAERKAAIEREKLNGVKNVVDVKKVESPSNLLGLADVFKKSVGFDAEESPAPVLEVEDVDSEFEREKAALEASLIQLDNELKSNNKQASNKNETPLPEFRTKLISSFDDEDLPY